MIDEPQKIVFFLDRCLGSQQIAQALRATGITLEIHDDNFDKNAPDVEWLAEVGQRNWVILTKDARISRNTLERLAVASAGIKMFTLASQKLSGLEMIEIFTRAIIPMQEFILNNQAPFIAKIYRDGRIEMWKDNMILRQELQSYEGF